MFAVDRGIWDHDLLVGPEPFSRREAWLWLISEAAWRPHRRRLAGRTIDVRRGQVAASLRFIACKWRWTEPRVRRFLAALISDQMIDATADAGVTVITVCKYKEYQRVSLPIDATPEVELDAGATQERRKVEDKEYKEEKRKENPSDSPKESRPSRTGTRLQENWSLSQADYEFATLKAGLSDQTAAIEADKFRDYWRAQPGQRGVKLDWPATWRNWCRTAAQRSGASAQPKPHRAEAMIESLARAAARRDAK